MVIGRTALVAVALGLLGLTAGSSCKVLNEEHCANQDVPGNEFCRELSEASPFCSPCRRELNGCVEYPPYSCGGYYDELAEEQASGTASGTAGGASMGGATGNATTGGAEPMNTGPGMGSAGSGG